MMVPSGTKMLLKSLHSVHMVTFVPLAKMSLAMDLAYTPEPTIEIFTIFSFFLGRQGGAADMMQAEKVPLLKAVKSSLEIGWDGGANLSNVRAIAHAGVEVINVGSAITNADDPAEMYQALITESEKKGVLI